MIWHTRRNPRIFGSRNRFASEKGQAALAIILGIVLVMVTVPLVADLLVTNQEAVVFTSQDQTEALQAAQAGLADFENHVEADAYYASPTYKQGYCSANGPSSQPNSFLNNEAIPGGGGTSYSGCDSNMSTLTPPLTPSGQTDPNDPGFSNQFDSSCPSDSATASSTTVNSSFNWDLYSGSGVAGQNNSEYQFLVDARAVTTGNIDAGEAVAYVYVTGRAGTSGHYLCRSIKAAVNVLDPSASNVVTTSTWGAPSITEPTPVPVGNQTVSFSITGASGAAGGGGLGVKGGAGGLGGTVSGTFTAPADYPGTSTPIYFGTWAGNAGNLGTAVAAGYNEGGQGGLHGIFAGGGGGASSVFCILPDTATSTGTCNTTTRMPMCSAVFNADTGAGLTQAETTGCVFAIAAGGGGGGESLLDTFNAGAGGHGGVSPTAGGNSTWNFFGIFTITVQTNGGGAGKVGGTTGGSGTVFGLFNTANGGVGTGAATSISGGSGASYGLGAQGGGGGGGFWGGAGGGAGFLLFGAGGGGGGLNTSDSWTNLNGTSAPITNGIAPAGTTNGLATLSVTTNTNNFVPETYTSGCTNTGSTASETAAPPTSSNATWLSVTAQVAGGGGGGAAVPAEKSSTEPYGEPGGVAGYVGGTNGTDNGTVTLTFDGTTGTPSPPNFSYQLGCGGGGADAGGGSSTVAAGDNGVTLSNLAGTLDVVSSSTFSASGGQISVTTASGTATFSYTGVGTGTLTGLTLLSGTTTWTVATGNAVTSATVAGTAGYGFGAGGAGGVGKNSGTANNGASAGSGGGGGATALCLGTTCSTSASTCTSSTSGSSCILAVAGGGGGGAEGTSDGKTGTSPAGAGGPGWGGGTNGSPTTGLYDSGGSLTHYNYTWYWPDDSATPVDISGGGTTPNTNSALMNYKSGSGTQGSFAPNTGGNGGGGGSVTAAGTGAASASGTGCPGAGAGSGFTGGTGETTSCETAGGGGGGGYDGGGGGGGGTGGAYGGGGGGSYVYGYANGSGTGVSQTMSTVPTTGGTGLTSVGVANVGSPFVEPVGSSATAPTVSFGAAGSGATTTSTTAGASGLHGQNGVVILDWYYQAAGQPEVTDACTPTTGIFIQGPGTDTSTTTYLSNPGPTTFELSGGSGGNSMYGDTTGGATDVEYVTVNIQPGEIFSYLEGCTGYLSLAGAGFLPGGSSGATSSPQFASFGSETNQYIGGTDYGGEAGGGGGASALCAGDASGGVSSCNSDLPLCLTSWTTTSNCVLAVAGGGGGAGADTWQNGSTTGACTVGALSMTGGIGGGGTTIPEATQTFYSGQLTPGGNGGDEAFGGDNGTGSYSTSAPYTAVADPLPTTNNESSSASFTSTNGPTLYGTAGAGGGFEGGQPGQSYTGSAGPPVVAGCAGGGGSVWALYVAAGNNSVNSSMTNPLTGTTSTVTGAGNVTVQGYSTNITAERSTSVWSQGASLSW